MPSIERRDLFGRTEPEARAAVARAERIWKIASTWGGNEGSSKSKREIVKANLEVDRHQLAILRGESVDDLPRLSDAARSKLYRELISRNPTFYRG